MNLFHFSTDPAIAEFVPRPVQVPSRRAPGMDWLNGPLVWAVDAWHQPTYFFPRDCPRILLWRTPATTPADAQRYFGDSQARMLAFIEAAWQAQLEAGTVERYTLPPENFVSLIDAGMWVCKTAVTPICHETLRDLPAHLRAAAVDLRVLPSLLPLRDVWQSTLHASGIRLRNAIGWPQT